MTRIDEAPRTRPPQPAPHRRAGLGASARSGAAVLPGRLAGGGPTRASSATSRRTTTRRSCRPRPTPRRWPTRRRSSTERCRRSPGFVVYQRDGGLTAPDKQKIDADVAPVPQPRRRRGRAGRRSRSTAPTGEVAAISVPLIGKQGNGSRQRPRTRRHGRRPCSRPPRAAALRPGWWCTAPAPAACSSPSSTRSAAWTARCCCAAGIVVVVILLFVYRSPVLWFFPLFSAVLALGAAVAGDLPAGQARRDHPQRAEPGHPVGAGHRRRHRLRAAAGQPLPRGTARVPEPGRRDDRGVEGRGAADRRLGGDRHPRPALPDARRAELDRQPRAGLRHRHRLHGASSC